MRFNPDLDELIPASHLDADFGGEYEFEFEPEEYWRQIVECVLAGLVKLHPDPRNLGIVKLPAMVRAS